MNDFDEDKIMAKLFGNLYASCLKYNEIQRKDEDLMNCVEYYEKFKFYSIKIKEKDNHGSDIN